MPPTVTQFVRDDSTATAPAATPVARRRRRGLPHRGADAQAHAALQRALDRRDNGGATGH
ncbi:hypothetical protein [Kitasatospora viridis]|uniref:Uncharacterized protein n=1 Tax=Kitasatospora viridis TaxID=281105 RepID=A0A561UEK7_9ACTN|nr:hypothetical protein [Kitasatospora viridis]TWF97794.1 hypothetical protein FHX73_111594 [Kitasatospora viridis]